MDRLERRRGRAGKFSLLIIILGLTVTGLDLFSTLRGWEICPYEGCRLALNSPYSRLLGIPLSALGLAFFLVALFLMAAPKRWMLFWSALGLGASIYFLYLQKWVLGEMCMVCVAVELLVLLLFLSALTRVSFWCLVALVALAFAGVHAAYTWGPSRGEVCLGREEKAMLQRYYTTKGGAREAVFFFSLECPACARTLPLVKEWSLKNRVKVVFREVMIHGEREKALYLLSLLKGGMGPWEAIARVERTQRVPRVALSKGEERVLMRLLDFNGLLLRGMGFQGVPALLVREGGQVEVRQGLEGVRELISPHGKGGVKLGITQPPGEVELASPMGGVCTPTKCQD